MKSCKFCLSNQADAICPDCVRKIETLLAAGYTWNQIVSIPVWPAPQPVQLEMDYG